MADTTQQATRKRLTEIEKELQHYNEIHTALKARWETEKEQIQRSRSLKAEIEELKVQAAEAERQGDFGKVAEIRYGKIHQMEKELEQINTKLADLQQKDKMLKEEIDAEDIAEIVAKWTGVPVQRMLETERTKLLNMEDRLHQRVIDQKDAIHAIANAIRRSRAGLQDPNRPVGSFIFLGTTGVGKTEMARALAEFLFDDEHAMVRIDMSEYMEKHAVSRLMGAPPGYVGYEEGGQLTEAIRQRPYSVILLDEIEKAHNDVFNILLQVLDDGRLTDSKGRTVNFKNTIIIMTSNLGTDVMQDRLLDINEENRDQVMSEVRVKIIDVLRSRMRPEFLNRVDEIILFKPLVRSEVHQIAQLQLNKLRDKLKQNDIELEVTEDALDWITRVGYDPQYGARPLKRAIQKHITDALAMKMLSAEFSSGDKVKIDADEAGTLKIEKA